MASQPSNTDIQVFRTVRSFREDLRHESVKALTGRLRPLVFSVPAQTDRVEVKARTAAVTDFSAFMGQPAAGATRGLPVVIGPRDAKTFDTVESLTGINFPFTVGADKFVETSSANLAANDLHQQLRDA